MGFWGLILGYEEENIMFKKNRKNKNCFIGFLILILNLLLFIGAAKAVVYVDQNATGANNGTSWADAYAHLNFALINTANDEIWVSAGRYVAPGPENNRKISFRLKNGVALYGGFNGTETSRNQRDWVANQTILSGDLLDDDLPGGINMLDNTAHVVTAKFVNNTAVIDGFTIESGYPLGNDLIYLDGYAYAGGIYIVQGTPKLQNLTIRNNIAMYGGAGITRWGKGTLVIRDSVFTGNWTFDGKGGAIYNDYDFNFPLKSQLKVIN